VSKGWVGVKMAIKKEGGANILNGIQKGGRGIDFQR
jgi:hypothetical protein